MAWGRVSEINFYGKPNLGVASVLLFGWVQEGNFHVARLFVEGGGRGRGNTYENHAKNLQIISKFALAPVVIRFKRAQAPVVIRFPMGQAPVDIRL